MGKNIYNQMVAKAKKVKLTEACIKLLVVFLETSEISKMELFMKIVNSIKPLTIFTKGFILDVWLGSKHTSLFKIDQNKRFYNFFEYSVVVSSLHIECVI